MPTSIKVMLAGCDSSASDLQYLRQQEQEQIWHPEKLKLQRELLPDALGSRVVALGTGLAGCQQLGEAAKLKDQRRPRRENRATREPSRRVALPNPAAARHGQSGGGVSKIESS